MMLRMSRWTFNCVSLKQLGEISGISSPLGLMLPKDGIDFRKFSTFDVAGLRSRSFPPILLLTSESGENP